MKRFTIQVPELHYATYNVFAETKEEAFDAVDTGDDVDFIYTEFSRVIERTEKDWIVVSEDEIKDEN